MFRKTKMILITFLGIIGLACSTAFSVWAFDDKTTGFTEMNSTNGIDDIKENYSFGAPKPIYKTYTMYLFPSAMYGDSFFLTQALKDIGLTEGTTEWNDYMAHPEWIYGCITPILDDNGLPSIDPTTNWAQYKKINYNYNLNSADIPLANKWADEDTKINPQKWNGGYVRTVKKFDNNDSYYLDFKYANDKDGKSRLRRDIIYDDYRDNYGTWNGTDFVGGLKDWAKKNVSLQETVKGPYGQDWHYQGFAHKRENRFGFWNKVEYGNLLPMSLTINGSISATLFSQVVPKPFSSMGDAESYYNFSFASWLYSNSEKGGNAYPNKNWRFGYNNYDIEFIYDVMNNLDKYADTNGIIRLYPSYSNGKNYDDQAKLNEGRRDAFKINFNYNDNIYNAVHNLGLIAPCETYFTYVKQDKFYNKDPIVGELESLNFCMLKNFNLSKGIYKNISISCHAAHGPGAYEGNGWNNLIFDYDATTINHYLDTYGEGLYNIYLFVGNSGHADISTSGIFGDRISTSNWSKAKRWVNTKIDDKINVCDEAVKKGTGFKDLLNKQLYPLTDKNNVCSSFADDTINIKVGDTAWDTYDVSYNHRPVYITFEKVADFTMFTDLHINTGDKPSSTYVETATKIEKDVYNSTTSWSDIEDEIIAKKDSSQSLVNASNLWYGNDDANGNFIPSKNYKDEVSTTTPYVYFIKNVDFTEANSLYFQVRMSEQYIDLDFVTNPGIGREQIAFFPSDPYVPDTKEIQKFTAGYKNEFIDYVKINASLPDGTSEMRNMFRLKNDEAKGIYDFVFVKDGTTNRFFMYVYRHRNIFVKILTDKVNSLAEDLIGPDGKPTGEKVVYADHNNLAPGNTKIWESSFYIGESIKGSKEDKDNKNPLTVAIGKYMDETTKATGKTCDSVSLLDHVTGLPVCYFTRKNGVILTHTLAVPNGGENVPIFKILKNYILYVTPGIIKTVEAIQA